MPVDALLLDKVVALTAALMSVSLLVFFAQSRSRVLLFWSVGLMLLAAGYLLSAFKAEQQIALILGKTAISLGVSAMIYGVLSLGGERVRPLMLFLPVLMMFINQAIGGDDHIQRASGCSLILGTQFFALAISILLVQGNPLIQERVVLLTVALIPGVVYMFRALIYLMTPSAEFFAVDNSPLQLLSLYVMLLFMPAAVVSLVLMQNRRQAYGI